MRTKNAMRLFSLLAVLTVLAVLPGLALATEKGTIREITAVGTVTGDSITVAGAELDWYNEDRSIGRYQEGWWVGVDIIAPASVNDSNVSKVWYSNDGSDNLEKKFDDSDDGKIKSGDFSGRYHITCWLPVKGEYLEAFLKYGSDLTWEYKFDWDSTDTNKGNSVDQTFTIKVKPQNITLNKDGGVYCQTVDGVMVIKEGKRIPADYSKVEDALALIPSDLSPYTEESVKALTNARNAVIPGKRIDEQDVVDGYAAAIKKAVNALKFKPVNLPQTGDHSDLALWASLLALACAGMAAAGLRGRKRNQEH